MCKWTCVGLLGSHLATFHIISNAFKRHLKNWQSFLNTNCNYEYSQVVFILMVCIYTRCPSRIPRWVYNFTFWVRRLQVQLTTKLNWIRSSSCVFCLYILINLIEIHIDCQPSELQACAKDFVFFILFRFLVYLVGQQKLTPSSN